VSHRRKVVLTSVATLVVVAVLLLTVPVAGAFVLVCALLLAAVEINPADRRRGGGPSRP
jgi:hypothetical protein